MWGEVNTPVPEQNQIVDLSSVMEQARQNDCLSMYNIPSNIVENREITLPPMNTRMLYAGELHKYVRSMTDVIKEAELAVKYNLLMQSEMPPVATPAAPTDTGTVLTRKPLQFVDKEYSPFTMGFGKNPPFLTETTRRKVEEKCIATILCQIGLLSTNTTVLDVLTDIFETFMKNICNDLRIAHDAELSGQHTGFSDIVEKVLIQNGLDGVRGICDYYEKRVKQYDSILKQRYSSVLSKYESLAVPVNMQLEAKTDRLDEMDTEDVPEVHFTAMDGEEGYLQPFLESGFQMLDSLEEGQL